MGAVPFTVRGWMSWRFPLWLQILLTGSVQVTLVCLCGWRRCLCGGVGASAPVCGSGAVSHRGSGECAEGLSRCVGRRLRGDVLRGSSLSSLRGSGWCQLLGIAEGMPRCAGRGGACNVSGLEYGSARIGWQFLTVAAPLRQSTCMKGLGLSIFDRYLSATSLSRFSLVGPSLGRTLPQPESRLWPSPQRSLACRSSPSGAS